MPNQTQPVVTILMPIFNSDQFLSASLDSVIKQTYKDWELLCIDDASTDNSAEIIKLYAKKDKRIHFLSNKFKKGISGALNTGLEAAKGIYIARADSDDINRPYRLEKQVAFLDKHRNIFIVGGGYAPFNEQGTRLNILHPRPSIEIAWKYITNAYFCHPAVMFRIEVYKNLGGYPYVAAEDYEYFSQIVKKYPGYNIQEVLIDYREHQSNLSKTTSDAMQKQVEQTSLENYIFYNKSQENYAIIKDYQVNRTVIAKNLLVLTFKTWTILNSIRRNYHLSIFAKDFWQLYLKLTGDYLKIAVNKLLARFNIRLIPINS